MVVAPRFHHTEEMLEGRLFMPLLVDAQLAADRAKPRRHPTCLPKRPAELAS